jgi:hypothetical protein
VSRQTGWTGLGKSRNHFVTNPFPPGASCQLILKLFIETDNRAKLSCPIRLVDKEI